MRTFQCIIAHLLNLMFCLNYLGSNTVIGDITTDYANLNGNEMPGPFDSNPVTDSIVESNTLETTIVMNAKSN